MTKYKEIIGVDIQTVTTDPTEVTGQVWYNESEGELKTLNQFVGNAWATGNTMNTARSLAMGFGTQTAALATGGENPTPSYLVDTELYNGTNWTEVNNLNTAVAAAGAAGVQTSGLVFSGILGPGSTTDHTESWNGTNWTEVNAMFTGRFNL